MLEKEIAIGYYLRHKCLQITVKQRMGMVLMIEDLYKLRQYYLETFYLAVSIADRYLIGLTVREERAPCLVTLGVTCLLLAAKIEQHKNPRFSLMSNVLEKLHDVQIDNQLLLDLEHRILKMLDFDLRIVSPIAFLERY